jgi:hypothetical protein
MQHLFLKWVDDEEDLAEFHFAPFSDCSHCDTLTVKLPYLLVKWRDKVMIMEKLRGPLEIGLFLGKMIRTDVVWQV